MSGTINLALTQQFDMNGLPLSGGRLFFFAAGTSTPQNAFQDTALAIVHPNPLILDASGRVPMFYLADGSIKVRLEDDSGLTIFAADNLLVVGPSSGGGGGGGTDATTVMQTGDVKARYGTGSHTGFVRCNGNTIGNSASSSSELADATAEQLFKYLWTTPLPMLTSGGGAAVKTTAAADWLGNNRMTLPDLRGRTIAGMDDMGAAAASRLTSAGLGVAGTTLGNAGGVETFALTANHLPVHTHSVGGTLTTSSGSNSLLNGHSHQVTAVLTTPGSFSVASGVAATVQLPMPNPAAATSDTVNLQHTHTISLPTDTGNNTTTASATPLVAPSLVMTFYIKL